MARQLISSGSTFERDIGYSRAVVDGDWIFVSGTTGFDYATMTISDNLLDQTDQCLKNIQAALAEAGATQVEPGHGLTGTTPLHAVADLPERPAVVYLTEVSHLVGDEAFCFGGGLYVDPVFPAYQVKAIVSSEPTTAAAALFNVELPTSDAIDYYGMIDASGASKPRSGDSVVFGFRPQAFVTRAYVVGVAGLSRNKPIIEGVYDAFGRQTEWP